MAIMRRLYRYVCARSFVLKGIVWLGTGVAMFVAIESNLLNIPRKDMWPARIVAFAGLIAFGARLLLSNRH